MAESPSKVLRFTKITLENWRNFSKVEIDLKKRAIFVGPNASGKSNLLDAFRFLKDIVAVGGGFQEAVRNRGGVSSIRCLSARRQSSILVKVRIGDDTENDLWEYEIKFKQDKQKRPILEREVVKFKGEVRLERPVKEDKQDIERLTQTFLEQVNTNIDFRDIVSFLLRVRYIHIVPQLIKEPDRSVGKVNDPYGGDFLEQIAKTHQKILDARLKKIKDALKVAVPQLVELELIRDNRGVPHLRGRFVHWRAGGNLQTEENFSDGTLRLLGLLWAIFDGTGPLLLEEPELSLHSEIVRMIPQVFARIQNKSGKQVLISTHSTDLLTDRGIGLDELFILEPRGEGTSVRPASGIEGIRQLIIGGINLADVVIPHTSPKDLSQLILFD